MSQVERGWERRGNALDQELACELTADELKAAGKELADLELEYDRVDEERKASAKEYREQLKEIGADIDRHAAMVSTGTETRSVPCSVWVDWEGGRKLVVRDDTMEVVDEHILSADERQEEMFGKAEPQDETDAAAE